MTESQSERIVELLAAARALPVEERERFLFEQCAGDWGTFALAMDELGGVVTNAGNEDGESDDISGDVASRGGGDASAVVGRYRLIDVLGEGGMGVVYLAEQQHPLRRRVALKVMKADSVTRSARMRFEAESQALAAMNHPNIARLFEAGITAEGRSFFAMEHVPGLPITDYCDEARMSVKGRLRLFADVCHAVAHAHQNGIIHRDIKPSNILVANIDGAHVPKIIDFGVAKLTADTEGTPRSGSSGVIAPGSVAYMSPEQADPQVGDVDTRSDIYSLGVLLYGLLAGNAPIDLAVESDSSLVDIAHRICVVEPGRLSSRLPAPAGAAERVAAARGANVGELMRELRDEIDWIALKAVAKEKSQRYQTATELAADVERCLAGDPVIAAPPRAGYRLARFLSRNRAVVVSINAFVLALVLGVTSTTTLLLKNRSAASVAKRQSEDILRLADTILLESCREEASRLLPPYPEKIAAMEKWLEGTARELADRLPLHRQTLQALEREARPAASATGSSRRFDDPEKQFHYDLLLQLVANLETFLDADPHTGTMADVAHRLRIARSIYEESITRHEIEWKRAIESIADRNDCPLYDGLRIVPQIGLAPIGRNPESGLWEFVDLFTGVLPKVDDEGHVIIDAGTGVILVLVPGGRFWMGTTVEPLDSPGLESGFAGARKTEGPPHPVRLDPFFIGKFEMSQAQWTRLAGANPSVFATGTERDGAVFSDLHPVERVTWRECVVALMHAGLTLPTEAQWEYAARGGTNTPWWCGREPGCLRAVANLADQSARDGGRPTTWTYVPWRDEFVHTSPIGSFAANPFGLHDVYGNVEEWCLDAFAPYLNQVRASDGLRLAQPSESRACRGGNATMSAQLARSAFRRYLHSGDRDLVGARPVRALDTVVSDARGRGE